MRLLNGTARHPQQRIAYKKPETGKWTSHVIRPWENAETVFDELERELDRPAVPVARVPVAPPTMNELCDRYELSLRDRSDSYQAKVANILAVWVRPRIGQLPVEDWSVTHSEDVLSAARAAVSDYRVEDIGCALSGLRRSAHRKPAWLARDDDPLEGVRYTRSTRVERAHRNFVPVRRRPTTDQVRSVVEAAAWIEGLADVGSDSFSLQLQVAAFLGPRRAEQLGLRATDVDLERYGVRIEGAWYEPRPFTDPDTGDRVVPPAYRKSTKTRTERVAPFADSLCPPLSRLVAGRLGLPAETDLPGILRAQEAARAAGRDVYLFIDPRTGEPWTTTRLRTLWLRAVRRTRHEEHRGLPWPKAVPFKNLRHHAAHYLEEATGQKPVVVAGWLGNDQKTLQEHYQLGSDEDWDRSRQRLAAL